MPPRPKPTSTTRTARKQSQPGSAATSRQRQKTSPETQRNSTGDPAEPNPDDAETDVSSSDSEWEEKPRDWEERKEAKKPVKFINPLSAPESKKVDWAERALLKVNDPRYVNLLGLKMRPIPGHGGRLNSRQKRAMHAINRTIEAGLERRSD